MAHKVSSSCPIVGGEPGHVFLGRGGHNLFI